MDYIGLLNICKLPGLSSHEVVSRVRRIAGIKRVGHTGTLDPAACGVLPICVGSATRLADYIAAGPKSYRAEFCFGLTTDSDDADGVILATVDASQVTEEMVTAALPRFVGAIMQRPPDRSAIWIDGVRAYNRVLKGEAFDMPEREITVHGFTPVRFVPGPQPRLLADIVVSKGTYIRSLARDLGAVFGVGATLSFLGRTQVGDCTLENSVTIEELGEASQRGEFERWLRPADAAITYIPSIRLPAADENYRMGVEKKSDEAPGLYRIYIGDVFAGLGRILDTGMLRPTVNLR